MGFAKFRAPVELAAVSRRRHDASGASLIETDRSALFDFYSRWTFLLAKLMEVRRL